MQPAINHLKEQDWPQLYAVASTGKIKTWRTWVQQELDGCATIWTQHGYIDGKLQTKPKVIDKGKNIGKANETTPFEQACSQAQSTFNKKIDKKYITEIPNGDNAPDHIILPMLAQPFKKYRHRIAYPAMVQPKLNGVRCLAHKYTDKDNVIVIDLISRGGKSYNDTLYHLLPELHKIMDVNQILDGEIYRHGWNLQQISRRVKKVRADTDKLEFWVYDVADESLPTVHRNDLYFKVIGPGQNNNDKIVSVYTDMVANENEVYSRHNDFVSEGFEGIIIRNGGAYYRFDHRSMDLQKFKLFQDAEFKIIGASADAEGGVVFECEANDKYDFSVRPRGSLALRKKWLANAGDFMGKPLTVRFFEYSEDGIPQQPVGIVVRDYEN